MREELQPGSRRQGERQFFVDNGIYAPVMARTTRVTLGLIGAGMVAGALVGIAAILPLWLQHVLQPTPYDGELGSARSWIPVCASVGAVVGGILGPSLGYGLLRSVALWRVVIEPVAGAAVGCAVGWAIFRSRWLPGLPGASAIIWASALGALGAGIRLRLRYSPSTTHGPESLHADLDVR